MASMDINDDELHKIVKNWFEKKLGHKVRGVMIVEKKGDFPNTKAILTTASCWWDEPKESEDDEQA